MRVACLSGFIVIVFVFVFIGNAVSFAGRYALEIGEDTLTLQAENAPLAEILKALEMKSNIRVKSILKPDERISADIQEIEVRQELELLLRNYNHSIVYRESASGSNSVIEAVFIYSRSGHKDSHLLFRSETKKGQAAVMIPELQDPGGRINAFNMTPVHGAHQSGMSDVDPLMRFKTDRPQMEPAMQMSNFLPEPTSLQ